MRATARASSRYEGTPVAGSLVGVLVVAVPIWVSTWISTPSGVGRLVSSVSLLDDSIVVTTDDAERAGVDGAGVDVVLGGELFEDVGVVLGAALVVLEAGAEEVVVDAVDEDGVVAGIVDGGAPVVVVVGASAQAVIEPVWVNPYCAPSPAVTTTDHVWKAALSGLATVWE